MTRRHPKRPSVRPGPLDPRTPVTLSEQAKRTAWGLLWSAMSGEAKPEQGQLDAATVPQPRDQS